MSCEFKTLEKTVILTAILPLVDEKLNAEFNLDFFRELALLVDFQFPELFEENGFFGEENTLFTVLISIVFFTISQGKFISNELSLAASTQLGTLINNEEYSIEHDARDAVNSLLERAKAALIGAPTIKDPGFNWN